MKRKLRIGLTTEFIILIVTSLIITWLFPIIIFPIMGYPTERLEYSTSEVLHPENFKEETILERYKSNFHPIINKIISKNENTVKIPHKLDEKLKKEFPNEWDFVCIFNSDGDILHCNNKENIYNIKKDKIRETLELKKEKYSREVDIKEIKKINNDVYVLIITHTAISTGLPLVFIIICIWIVVFSILVKGRLRYIIFIEKGVKKLYSSNFEKKIPLKYNNELTSLAVALNDMGDTIKENKKNEEEFLLNISHDLRTPLTSILGFLNLLKQKKYDTEEEKEGYINTIEEQSLYLKTLIDEFFQFSKLKWKNVKLNKENINIQEILRQISDGFYPQLKENKISISMNFAEKPLYKEVDVDKFMRVLENVISNAIKYSHKGTEISLNLYENKDRIVMEFWNTPIENLKEDELDFLFKRFYKKDLSRGSKGAGLGLAIALEVIKLHEGELYAVMKNEKLGIIIKL